MKIIMISLVIFGLINGFYWIFKQPCRIDSENKNIIRQPILYKNVGYGGISIFTAIAVYMLYQEGLNIYGFTIFITLMVFNILYVYLIILQINWKIQFKDDYILFTGFFNKTKKYLFNELKIKKNKHSYKLYFNKNNKYIASVFVLQTNLVLFLSTIKGWEKKNKKSIMN